MVFTWVTLRVRDLERAQAFYRDVIGLPLHSTHGGGRILMFGKDKEAMVELMQEDGPVDPGTGASVGFAVDSLEEAMAHVAKHGFPIESGPVMPNPHIRFAFLRDPDGYLVQLVENKK